MKINFEKLNRSKNKEQNFLKQETDEHYFEDEYMKDYYDFLLKDTKENFVDDRYEELVATESVGDSDSYFDPEIELSKILKLSAGKEKEDSLEDFKYFFAYQQKGFLNLKKHLFNLLREKEELKKEDFLNTVDIFKIKYRFSPNQIILVCGMIDEFFYKHQAVNNFYKKHDGNPALMYKDLISIDAVGEIRLHKGPISISLLFNKIIDYTRFYYQSSDINDDNHELLNHTNMSGGFFNPGAPNDNYQNLKGVFIGVNGIANYADVIKHEEQHALNRIYINNFAEFDKKNLALNLHNKTLEQAEILINKYAEGVISEYSHRTKDEIIAYKVDGSSNSYIIKTLIQPKSDGGIYDYFDVKKHNVKIKKNLLYNVDESDDLISKVENIISHKYENLITEGVEAYSFLEVQGYNHESIVALLAPYPLSKWGKVVKRFLDNVENDKTLSTTKIGDVLEQIKKTN